MPRLSDDHATPSRSLIVVSNREPYMHVRRADDGPIDVVSTTGGMAVALDALMRGRGGTWIAHGAGNADRVVVDRRDSVAVPPSAPAYTLRRIWLSEEEERQYYIGFANEGLWPLCHTVHVRPTFRTADWTQYRAVNGRFAQAVAAEMRDLNTPVFIQDYHLALTAASLRMMRPEAQTALFWHIPWPHPDRLRLCPWRREIVRGLLANSLVVFQLERDRRNFLQGVREELPDVTVDSDGVLLNGRYTNVTAVPIGVDYDRIQRLASAQDFDSQAARLREELRLNEPGIEIIGVGVDRLDYTKGIPERLDALDLLLTNRPDLRGKLVFVQVGVPSRSSIAAYAEMERTIDAKVAAINRKHGTGPDDGPIRYRKSSLDLGRLVVLYRLASFCIVSALHDGMNLVAKEFVAARRDEDGVLVLSELTGAAQELKEALLVNPYHVDGFAQAIERAIAMSAAERRRRITSLRRVVADHDVFVWASAILERLETARPRLSEVRSRVLRGGGQIPVSAAADMRSNVRR